jgi:hypothetical protein
MGRTYSEPDAATLAMAADVMAVHHQRLIDAEVTVCYRMVHAPRDKKGEPKGPALKVHGVQAAGSVRINSLKDRSQGLADATVLLDGDRWDDWPEQTQRALLSHELTHLEPTGAVDDLGRPKLEMRQHDADVGVFFGVMETFLEAALDTQVVAKLTEDTRVWVQPLLQLG